MSCDAAPGHATSRQDGAITLAIMQPYLFPYLGYFQLLSAVDRFIIYNDVAFERSGWINRNRLLDPDKREPFWVTVPVRAAPKGTTIAKKQIHGPARWRERLLRRIRACYRRAPYIGQTWPLVERVLSNPEPNLGAFATTALRETCKHLGLKTPLVSSEDRYPDSDSGPQQRIIEICRHEGADRYLNPEGGRHLYDPESFALAGIELRFVDHIETPYPQTAPGFIPRLSVLDALMNSGVRGVTGLLSNYKLQAS